MKAYLISFLLFFSFTANAQITFYHSYQDFEDSNGEKYDKIVAYRLNGPSIKVKKEGGKSLKFKYVSFWGFEFGGSLFRIDQTSGNSAMLVLDKKFCYYENGMAHIHRIFTGEPGFDIYQVQGDFFYLSDSLGSELLAVPSSKNKKHYAFRDRYPQYSGFFECVDKLKRKNFKENLLILRNCIIELGWD